NVGLELPTVGEGARGAAPLADPHPSDGEKEKEGDDHSTRGWTASFPPSKKRWWRQNATLRHS
ncbi:MAG TPA: hypothetical protein PLS83_10895, partial [Methanothrix soehngenii]|nr:hypothetical protein [Methanothrix soehngenii]